MTVCLGRDRQRTVQHLTAIHTTVSDLTKKDSVRFDKENKRTWPQTVHGQLLLVPQLIR